ncbi:NAD(P)-dependent oxidoreductase [Pseudarthrobacter oxydans]|jgi:3-hydroxyisobutyrate dehydrogenase|uniref:NAD(P)-dependent oxidoreductase n=1 Tax=Pseudarthrobacter oxydans TaxID=1671 RepID=UPI002AA88AAB|nr:NAD(P)-dependent oxidoreductase [Pseudarthrobacter oxydans]WPU09500.1 NAD(P)-dependent oxidoreductase [Pseudarthrobacter oxydans]
MDVVIDRHRIRATTKSEDGSNRMKVGYIGLGNMGRGMALNLVKAGHDVTVFDLSSEAMDALVSAGAKAASSLRDLTKSVDVVFTSLPGPPQVEAVVLGPDGILDNIAPGKVLFELSTSSRELALRIHQAFAEKGATMLDAPVSGGPVGASSGDMAFWVGGDRETFERYLPLLKAMGDKPRHVGPIGSGTIVKLVNNLTGQMFLTVMAETFSVAVKAGVDPLELWDALRLGVIGKGSALNMLTQQFLPGHFDPPAFALNLAYKDVNLATQLGRDLGVPMRLANLTLAEMTEALGRGLGDKDCRIYMQLQLERAGVTIAVDPEELAARQANPPGQAG